MIFQVFLEMPLTCSTGSPPCLEVMKITTAHGPYLKPPKSFQIRQVPKLSPWYCSLKCCDIVIPIYQWDISQKKTKFIDWIHSHWYQRCVFCCLRGWSWHSRRPWRSAKDSRNWPHRMHQALGKIMRKSVSIRCFCEQDGKSQVEIDSASPIKL